MEVGIGESLVYKGRDGCFYFFVLKYWRGFLDGGGLVWFSSVVVIEGEGEGDLVCIIYIYICVFFNFCICVGLLRGRIRDILEMWLFCFLFVFCFCVCGESGGCLGVVSCKDDLFNGCGLLSFWVSVLFMWWWWCVGGCFKLGRVFVCLFLDVVCMGGE